MNLFDFIKVLFLKNKEYLKLKPYQKSKFFFMTNRFMGIRYPVQANLFNLNKIQPDKVLDYWQKNTPKMLVQGKIPYWIYTKTKGQKKTDPIKIPSEESTNFYLEKKGYSRKDLDQAISFFGQEAYKEIFKVERLRTEASS